MHWINFLSSQTASSTQGLIVSEFTAVCKQPDGSYYSLMEGGICTLLNKTVCIFSPFTSTLTLCKKTPMHWINFLSSQTASSTQGLIVSEFTAVCKQPDGSYYSLMEGGICTLLNKTVCIFRLLRRL